MQHFSDTAIKTFLVDHLLLVTFVVWFVSSIISGMPTPTPESSTAYRWAFNVFHTVAANPWRIAAVRSFAARAFQIVRWFLAG